MANKKLYDEEFENLGGEGSKAQEINAYYNMARQQNYSKLLDSEIQLENSKAAAMKYTANEINAKGFGTQGMSESTMTGIHGRYANAFNELQENYNDEDTELQKARISALEGLGEEDFQSTIQLISDSTNIDRLNELLIGYGYMEKDEETGEIGWVKEKPAGISQRDWAEIQYRYNLQSDVLEEENGGQYNTYFDRDDLDFAQYQSKDGSIYNIGEHYEKELDDLYVSVGKNQLGNGATIRVRNSEGDTIYLQWVGNGFQLVSRANFENSKEKWSLTRKNKTNTFTKL